MASSGKQFKALDVSKKFIPFPTLVEIIQKQPNLYSLKINQFALKDEHDPITSDFSHGDFADDESYDTRFMNDKYDFVNFLNKLSNKVPIFTQQLKELIVVDIRKEEVDPNVYDAGYSVKCDEKMNKIMHIMNKLAVLNGQTKNIKKRIENLLYGFYRENNCEKPLMPQVILTLISSYYDVSKWWSLSSLCFDHYIGSKLVDWVAFNCPQIQLLQLTKYWPSNKPNSCFNKLFTNAQSLTYLHVEQGYNHENQGYSVSLKDCKKINFGNFKGIKLTRTGNFLSGSPNFWIRPRGEFMQLIEEYFGKQEEKFHFCEFNDVQ